jgi:hypothetical protein
MVFDEFFEGPGQSGDGFTDGRESRWADFRVLKKFSFEPFIDTEAGRHPTALKRITDEAEEKKRSSENQDAVPKGFKNGEGDHRLAVCRYWAGAEGGE